MPLALPSASFGHRTPPVVTYDSLVLASSPLGYWKLDESSGTIYADSSVNSTTGQLFGSQFRQTDSIVTGNSNSLFLVNSTRTNEHDADTYVRLLNNVAGGHPFTNVGNNNNFTIEAWVQFRTDEHDPNSVNWAGRATIIELRRRVSSGSYLIPFNFGMDTGGVLSYGREAVSSSANNLVLDTTVINDGAIHHVVCVVQDAQVDFYVDGAFSSTANITGDATGDVSVGSNACDMVIGIRSRDDGSRDETGWCGMVSNVAVYGTALSAPTILAHYNAGTGQTAVKRTTYPAEISNLSPLSYWRLNEAKNDNTATDSGSNALDGTYTTFSTGERLMMPVIFEPDTTSAWFSGNDDVEILNSVAGGHPYTNFGDNDYTIEAWIYPNGTPGSGGSWWSGRCIIELRQQATGSGTVAFHFGLQTTQRLVLGMADNQSSSTDKALSPNSVISTAVRQHVAVTHSISGTPGSFVRTAEFFVNGVSVGTDTISCPGSVVTGATVCNMMIGARSTNAGSQTDHYRGFMHEVAIHNSVLSAPTLLAHYNAGVV